MSEDLAELRAVYESLLQSHNKLQEQVAGHAASLAAFSTVPIGTILPFYGDPAQLDRKTWIACTAEEHARDPGVPNLEGRFLMGVGVGIKDVTGGRERLVPQGQHSHGGFTGTISYAAGEINWQRGPGHHDQYSHRHGIRDDGQHDHGANGDLRPPFHGVTYIIRVG